MMILIPIPHSVVSALNVSSIIIILNWQVLLINAHFVHKWAHYNEYLNFATIKNDYSMTWHWEMKYKTPSWLLFSTFPIILTCWWNHHNYFETVCFVASRDGCGYSHHNFHNKCPSAWLEQDNRSHWARVVTQHPSCVGQYSSGGIWSSLIYELQLSFMRIWQHIKNKNMYFLKRNFHFEWGLFCYKMTPLCWENFVDHYGTLILYFGWEALLYRCQWMDKQIRSLLTLVLCLHCPFVETRDQVSISRIKIDYHHPHQ